ncbi:2-oxoacid:acceptor oxidoreductase family protein [Corticibacterium sp. UT-5YL-CI-8]|nr:2-oxoacid:acceptor oxidoreductase family protein [Tianweitania sp. UT-5YL-CI-8]
MESDLFISGIGGQGVQLIAKTLALAAIIEGRHVLLSGEYGGHMRGGSSVGTVVISPIPVRSLPILPDAGALIALTPLFWENVGPRLRRGALVLAEEAIVKDLPAMQEPRLVTVPATAIATGLGSRMAAGMVIVGAYGALTGIVSTESLVAAMKEQVPAYRRQHLETNEKAIWAGAGAVSPLAHPVAFARTLGALETGMVA